MARAQDLSVLDRDMAGPPTRLAVLGSVHLRMMDEGFDPASLEPLLDRLAAFAPEVITIESISGEGCDLVARHPGIYDPEGFAPYCSGTGEARAATGLDVPAAIAAVHDALADWPAQPAPSQRRHLAALFLAANDRASALTQWLQLPVPERRAGDGLDTTLATMLDGLVTARSEVYLIAAPLAARLGLQRVFPIDDHTGDSVDVPEAEVPAYAAAIRQAWASSGAQQQAIDQRVAALEQAGDMLALYRYVNRPDVLRARIDGDQGAAMREGSPRHYARIYVAGWETRNLRMVANIRAAFRERPGARVLSIVGSTHKPWFDTLLGQMQGVDVVDVEELLAPGP